MILTSPFIDEGKIRDRKLEAEIQLLQTLIDIEPKLIATGERVLIQTPFLETLKSDIYTKEKQQIDFEKVFGIAHWPELKKIEFKYMLKNKDLGAEAVKLDNVIMKIVKVDSKKLLNWFYPDFTVIRSDEKEYIFSEADFKSLNLNDIWSMHQLLAVHLGKKVPETRITYRAAFHSVTNFMKNIVKFAYITDLQMGLESFQKTVNLKKPRRTLPDLQGIPSYSVLAKPELGVAYVDIDSKKWFMRVSEMNKYCEGTMKMISIHLESRSRQDEVGLVKLKETEKERITEIMKFIKYRKD